MKRPALGHLLGYTALTVILTAGAAQSLSGSNTVFTDDIAPGQVRGSDLAANSVSGSKILNGSVTGSDVNESTLALTCPAGTTRYGGVCATAVRSADDHVDARTDCSDERLRLPTGGEAVMVAVASGVASGWTDATYYDGNDVRGVVSTGGIGLNTFELVSDTEVYRCVTTIGARP